MRWIIKERPPKPIPPKVEVGDERIITKFSWFPIRIRNEFCWMETVRIKQMWGVTMNFCGFNYHWINQEFLD